MRVLHRAWPAHTVSLLFFFNDTATTEIYTLSLHDALPISTFCSFFDSHRCIIMDGDVYPIPLEHRPPCAADDLVPPRSEEHTSELQSHLNLVCRLLLEKKNKATITATAID